MLLLDQRGTGRSTPLTRRLVEGWSDADIAAYVRLMRADSIVRDAEVLRERVAGGRTLGDARPELRRLRDDGLPLARARGADACYVTGGLPGLTATADEVYARTYPRVARKNAEFHARYPDDVPVLRRIADHLDAHVVELADGDRLTTRRLRLLGNAFGMSDGYEKVHWLLDEAWHGDRALRRLPGRRPGAHGVRRRPAVRAPGVLLRPARLRGRPRGRPSGRWRSSRSSPRTRTRCC